MPWTVALGTTGSEQVDEVLYGVLEAQFNFFLNNDLGVPGLSFHVGYMNSLYIRYAPRNPSESRGMCWERERWSAPQNCSGPPRWRGSGARTGRTRRTSGRRPSPSSASTRTTILPAHWLAQRKRSRAHASAQLTGKPCGGGGGRRLGRSPRYSAPQRVVKVPERAAVGREAQLECVRARAVLGSHQPRLRH